jgi:hypothetical protein
MRVQVPTNVVPISLSSPKRKIVVLVTQTVKCAALKTETCQLKWARLGRMTQALLSGRVSPSCKIAAVQLMATVACWLEAWASHAPVALAPFRWIAGARAVV